VAGLFGPQRKGCRAERFDARRHVRTRKANRESLLDLTPRLATRRCEQFLSVPVVQVPVQEEKSRQMNRAGTQLVEDPGKPKGKTRDACPLQRGILTISEAFAAMGVERPASLVEVEASAFHLHQVFDDVCGGGSFGMHDDGNACEQFSVGE
jgi:hypothetical protein